MDLTFDRGDQQRPKGHALVYFPVVSEPDKVYATYVVVLPIEIDFAKYVPPFLASHLGTMPLKDISAFSLPPVPEEMESYEQLQHLAEMRDDDLIRVFSTSSFDLPEMMQLVSDVVQQYAQLWSDSLKATPSPALEKAGDSLQVNEVLYSLMSGKDKVEELAKMISKLRFATEGNDQPMITEVEEEIRLLGKYLPQEYQVNDLLQAAGDSSTSSSQLAHLYLERCYKLSNGDSDGARDLEHQIESLKTSS